MATPHSSSSFLQHSQDEASQELQNITSSLPKEEAWITRHYYQYQGFWRLPTHLKGLLNCQKHFQAQESDIFLITPPKSGTTWLMVLLYAIIYRNKYQDLQNHPLLSHNPHMLVPLFEHPDSFDSVKSSACKIVFLCRNAKDDFVSLWHFTSKLRPKRRSSKPVRSGFHWCSV